MIIRNFQEMKQHMDFSDIFYDLSCSSTKKDCVD